MKKAILLTVGLALVFSIFGCQNKTSEANKTTLEQTTTEIKTTLHDDNLPYVKKVENLSNDFILGMDASCVPSLEASGVKYYDYDGNEEDVYKILADNGVNYIRVRIWNDPYDKDGNGYGGGNCDIENAIAIGKRATRYGMKLLVNFHYSDFWADPAKQMVPKAWKDLKLKADATLSPEDGNDDRYDRAKALYEYTKDCLERLVSEGVEIGMVQIGNETNGSMCGATKWVDIAALMKFGSLAIREVCPNALIAVHFANPEKITNYADYSSKLAYYNIDYDVFASSYYPYWHGTLENLSEVLTAVAQTYNKKVMVMETSYAYTNEDTDFNENTISDGGAITKNYPFTVQGQVNSVRDVIDTIANKTVNGIGVVYWEGTWISVGGASYEENQLLWERYGSGWASSYAKEYDPNDAGKYYGGCAVDNQAFFDANGHVLKSLQVFNLVKTGNENTIKVDALQDASLIYDLNGSVEYPTKVNAVMTDDSKQEVDVTWNSVYSVNTSTLEQTLISNKADNEAISYMKSHGPAKYAVHGEADGMNVTCYISMVEFNFLANYSFEEDANKTRTPSGWTVNEIGKAKELWVENKTTDSMTGDQHYHFWDGGTDTVEFYLEQKVDNLPQGKYKFSMSIMGGDAGTTTVYIYVKINGEMIETANGTITVYNSWDTMWIDSFDYNGTDEIIVGIYVKCSGSGNGAWGKIDDALLNSVVE